MEDHIPSALRFSHKQRYVKMPPDQVKKIVVIQGSPRKEGASKTDILAKAFIEGARKAGAESETIYLREKKIKQCQGCFTCWTKTPGKCIFTDDVADIMQKINESDLVVFASPLYHFGIIALMKKFIERTLPMIQPFLVVREDGKTTHPHRKGYKDTQNILIIGVCGFPEVEHFGAFSANFHYIANAGGDQGYNIVAEIYRPLSEVLNNPFYQAENDRVLGLAQTAGYDVVKKGFVDEDVINEIADVRLNKKEIYEMANLAWETCIKDCMTMGEFQEKLSGVKL
jgi:multimeric flavodoxin WrbA